MDASFLIQTSGSGSSICGSAHSWLLKTKSIHPTGLFNYTGTLSRQGVHFPRRDRMVIS